MYKLIPTIAVITELFRGLSPHRPNQALHQPFLETRPEIPRIRAAPLNLAPRAGLRHYPLALTRTLPLKRAYPV